MREAAADLLAATDARRVQLGKRWRQVYEEAGLTHQTLNRWRNGHGVDPLTERALERALEWAPGAREAIASGRDPVPLTEGPAEPEGGQTHTGGPDSTLDRELAFAARVMAAAITELGLSPDEADEAWRQARARIVQTHESEPGNRATPDTAHHRAG